jgi:RNA polymerase sigma-70 factor (ECF subfamily)
MDEETFYSQYRRRILVFIRNKINYHEDSEDICQDILKSVLEAMRNGKIKKSEKLSSFLYGVCSIKINDWIRRKYQKSGAQPCYSGYIEFPDPDANILEQLIKDEERKTIDQVLKRLNFTDRRIIYLRYYRGWQYEDIATFFDMKAATVRKAAQRARKTIYIQLKKKETFNSVTILILMLLIE